jgi:hypothetical protein
MKQPIQLFYLLLFGLISCQGNSQEKTTSNTKEVPVLRRTPYKGVPNDSLLAHIERAVMKEPKYEALLQKAKKIHSLTLDYQGYIDAIRQRMVEESGGAYTLEEAEKAGHPGLEGKPKGKRDKDSPQRIFVTGDYGAAGKKEPQGKVLAEKIKDLKAHYYRFIDELPGKKEALEGLKRAISLVGEEGYDPTTHNGRSWSEFTFGHMPVAALYPMLRKFQNDAKDSETVFFTFLIQQINGISFSAEERSYYALINHLNTRIMSSPVVDDPDGFATKNPQYKRIAIQIKKVQALSLAFNTYVGGLTEQMLEESGGKYTEEEAKEAGNSQLSGKLKGGNNQEVPYRIFITGDEDKEPQGKILAEKTKQLKADYIRLVGELWEYGGVKGTVFALQDKKEEVLELLASKIRLVDDEDYDFAGNGGKTWEENAFDGMPVKAIMLMLFHIESSVDQSEMSVMNFLISPLQNYK